MNKPFAEAADDLTQKHLKRSFLSSTASTTFANLFCSLIAFASAILFQKILSPDDFGVVGMVAFFVGIANLLKDGGLSSATVQQKEFSEVQGSSLFWANAFLGLIAAALIAMAGPFFAWVYGEPRLIGLAPLLALPILLSSFAQQHNAILMRKLKFKLLAIIQIVAALVSTSVGVWFLFRVRNYYAIIAIQITYSACTLVGAWLAAKWMPKLIFDFHATFGMLKFGKNVTVFSMMVYLTRNLDNFLIGRSFGAVELGQYTRGYAYMLRPLRQITGPINGVLNSYLPKILDSPNKFRRVYISCVEFVLLAACPLGLIAVSSADVLVDAAFGPTWAKSGTVIQILGACMFSQPLTTLLGTLFLSQDRSGEMAKCGAWTSGVTVLSFFVGLPWGAVGVATSYVVGFFLLQLPLAIFFAGSNGIITRLDLVRLAIRNLLFSISLLLVVFAFRFWLVPYLQSPNWMTLPLIGVLVFVIGCAAVQEKRRLVFELIVLLKNFRGAKT